VQQAHGDGGAAARGAGPAACGTRVGAAVRPAAVAVALATLQRGQVGSGGSRSGVMSSGTIAGHRELTGSE
jgi:hypothetical protein